MTQELLPCPFCENDELSHGWSSPGIDGSMSAGTVECHNCNALIYAETETKAIAAWNTRAQSGNWQETLNDIARLEADNAALRAEVERLRTVAKANNDLAKMQKAQIQELRQSQLRLMNDIQACRDALEGLLAVSVKQWVAATLRARTALERKP